jgi:hypothetical protein
MKLDLALFALFFGSAAIGGAVQFIIMMKMAARVRPENLMLRTTIYNVEREYKALFPNGELTRRLRFAVWVTIISMVGMMVMLFGFLPKYSLPSR